MIDETNAYAKKLEELGFVRFDPDKVQKQAQHMRFEIVDLDEQEPEPVYSRQVPLAENTPVFMMMEAGPGIDPCFSMTFADDGTRHYWLKRGETIDLSPFGFVDMFKRVSIQ